MTEKIKQKGSLGSIAEDLFVELFCDTFGPDQAEYLFLQYPVTDIYGNRRSIDFALESEDLKIAIEIDGETYHNPNKVSSNKYYDDLSKQNSLIYQNWKVYRWVYNQLKHQPEKVKDELRILDLYENGDIQVLCACDLLNEGWDSPKTEVLFMARPTLSKTLYVQQLGRGMRKCAGKDYLMVFDNAGLFNMPYSLHRMFNLKEYRAGEYVVASQKQFELDRDLIARGEKPSVFLDFPVNAADYELIDLFNWQDEVKGMISQLEFVRMVDVQTETIERYLHEGKITSDLEVPFGDKRSFKYFKEATVESYAKQYGWELINPANMKDKFIRWLSATNPLAA